MLVPMFKKSKLEYIDTKIDNLELYIKNKLQKFENQIVASEKSSMNLDPLKDPFYHRLHS